MALGREHVRGVQCVERVPVVKQQIHVLRRFAEEEALHAVALLPV